MARIPLLLQYQNIFHEKQTPEYQGGLIDGIQCIRCYRWFRQCGSLTATQNIAKTEKIVTWTRVSKNISKDSLYSIESGILFDTYLYVHRWKKSSATKPITELAISRDPSMIPLQVLQDVQKLIKSSDSSVFHNHIHRQQRPIWNFFSQWQPDSSDIYLLGEDWEYKGGGIWCKYEHNKSPVTDIELYLGSGFIESRPYWKEVIHEYSRGEGIHSLPMSITRETKPGPNMLRVSENKDELVNSLHIRSKMDREDTFRVLQITDVHFRCSDDTVAILNEFQTKHFISNTIDRETPDLVVITGDIIDGKNSLDYQTCIMKVVQPMIRANIPYAISFGISDFSPLATNLQIREFVSRLPLCLNKFASSEGHMAITSVLPSGSELVIYVLDSFAPIESFFEQMKEYKEFEYALVFRHLPIPEYRPEGVFPIIGQYNERSTFKLKSEEEVYIYDLLYAHNIKAISCGHEHNNDCCLQSRGEMWLCYGGCTGVGSDKIKSMEANVRLFQIDDSVKEITSWKRNIRHIDKVYDYQYILNKNNEN